MIWILLEAQIKMAMKKLIHKVSLLCMFFVALHGSTKAQIAWIEPDPTIVTDTIKLYIDLDKLDVSKEHNVLLQAHPGPFYIWTWSPFEHPVGSPKVNGEGEKPWKNSNEILKMEKDDSKGPKVYFYKMVPTDFYEVDAATVYSKGINFLVKPKDGGGYGDPDVKSTDMILAVKPPKLDKGTLYSFPSTILQDKLNCIIYDNSIEKKVTMQNLADGEALLYIKATIEDTAGVQSFIEPSKFLQLQNNPKLVMKKDATGKFKLYMIPDQFLNIPAGSTLKEIELTVRKKIWAGGADQIDNREKYKAGCK